MGRSKCLSSQWAGRSDSRPQTNSAAVCNKQSARSCIQCGHCRGVRIANMTPVQDSALWSPENIKASKQRGHADYQNLCVKGEVRGTFIIPRLVCPSVHPFSSTYARLSRGRNSPSIDTWTIFCVLQLLGIELLNFPRNVQSTKEDILTDSQTSDSVLVVEY